MIRKVKTKDLQIDMFIHDLNCSWLNHPFFKSGKSIRVESRETIEKIVSYGIKEVYIDTDKGLDVGEVAEKEETGEDLHVEIEKSADSRPEPVKRVSINEEIFNAKKIKKETIQTVRKIMDDIRLGRPIQKERVEEDVDNIIESLFRNSDALAGLARLRNVNDYLYSHSLSVCVMMVSFGKYLGFDSKTVRDIGMGAILHDIGAAKVPQEIINKERELTRKEYEKVKEHVQYSYTVLEQTEGISETAIMTAYQHHERINGTGYPLGLKGDEITRYGQAIAIVDVYDALTSRRSYRHKIQPTEAMRMIYHWKGSKFSEELVEHFIRCVGIYPVGALVGLESGLIGIVICHRGENLLQPVVRIVYDKKRNRYILPYDIDLSENGTADRIESYEHTEKWNIEPEMYL